MDKQEKYDRAYLKMANDWGQLSQCERKKVSNGEIVNLFLFR